MSTFFHSGTMFRGGPPPRWDPGPLPVLLVGRDKPLMRLRAAALERAGVKPRCLLPEEAAAPAHEPCRRVWLFCGSVEDLSLIYLGCAIRRHSPESRLLLVEHGTPAGLERALFHRVMGSGAQTELVTAAVQGAPGTA